MRRRSRSLLARRRSGGTVTPPPPPPPPPPGNGFSDVIKSIPGLTHYYSLLDVDQAQDTKGTLDGVVTGGVGFSSAGATFNGSNYITLPDSNDFSVTTTGELSIVVFQTPTNWAEGSRGSNGYCHWMGKGATSTTQEWTFRHYFDPDTSGQNRPRRTSVYHYSPADTLNNDHQGAGSYFQDADATGVERVIVANMDATTTSGVAGAGPNFPGAVWLYKNGVLRDSDGFENGGTYNIDPANTGSPVRIGTRDLQSFFIGRIRRVAFFNRKLTAAEIARINDAQDLPEYSAPPEPEPEPDPTFQMASLRSATMESKRSSANTLEKAIADGIHSEWVGDWVPTDQVQARIASFVTRAGGLPFTCAIYAIPNRDSGLYSAGGFPDRASYLAWVQKVRDGSGSAPVWWILEPDALPLSRNFTSTARAERQETLRQAVVILAQNPNAKIFIDCATWVPAAEMAGLLGPAGLSVADGFSCNVSNFVATSACTTWAEQVLTELGAAGTGKKYVVDTSRNRNGALTTAFPFSEPWHRVDPVYGQRTWCNPPGRGAGDFPQAPSALPNCAAYLWIKKMGESDGEFPKASENLVYATDAPIAGTWWEEWWDEFILDSAPRTYPVPGIVTAANVETTGFKPGPHNVGAGVLRAAPTVAISTADPGATYNSTTGVWTITQNLFNRVVTGYLKFGASNLVAENLIIKADPLRKPTTARLLVDTAGGFTNNVIRYSTAYGTFNTHLIKALGPRNITAEFCDFSRVTEVFDPVMAGTVTNVNFIARGNYAHHLQLALDPARDPVPATTAGGATIGGPHAGGRWNHCQVLAVDEDTITGVTVRGNTLLAAWADDETSLQPLPYKQANPAQLAVRNVFAVTLNGGRALDIDRNWLDGGEYCFNAPDGAVTGTADGNRFGLSMDSTGESPDRAAQFALMVASAGLTTTGNVWEDTSGVVPRRQIGTSEPPPPPPPPPTVATRLGACPANGQNVASVITKYGTGAAIRAFNSGALGGAQARPAGCSVMHASWKPALGSTISDASIIASFVNLRDGDMVEVQHESDVKYRKDAKAGLASALPDLQARLKLKNDFHDSVVRLRTAGSIPDVLTVNTWAGWAVDSGAGSPDRMNPVIHCKADVLGVDMDGIITTSDAYYDFAGRQLAETRIALFSEGFSYPGGWTVPEYCMPLYQQTDPTAVKRIAWFEEDVPQVIAGLPASGSLPKLGAPRMIAFFDFDNLEPDEGLHLANEIAAWRDLVQFYAP